MYEETLLEMTGSVERVVFGMKKMDIRYWSSTTARSWSPWWGPSPG